METTTVEELFKLLKYETWLQVVWEFKQNVPQLPLEIWLHILLYAKDNERAVILACNDVHYALQHSVSTLNEFLASRLSIGELPFMSMHARKRLSVHFPQKKHRGLYMKAFIYIDQVSVLFYWNREPVIFNYVLDNTSFLLLPCSKSTVLEKRFKLVGKPYYCKLLASKNLGKVPIATDPIPYVQMQQARNVADMLYYIIQQIPSNKPLIHHIRHCLNFSLHMDYKKMEHTFYLF